MKKFYSSILRKSGCLAFLICLFVSVIPFANLKGQITYVGESNNTTGSTTLTINKPAGLSVGDVMIVNIVQTNSNFSGLTDATRSNWKQIDGQYIAQSNYSNYYHDYRYKWRGTLLYKIADAADVAAVSYTFTLDGNAQYSQGAIVAFHNVDVTGGFDENGNANSGPFDVTPGGYNISYNSYTANASSITTVTPNAAVVMLGIQSDDQTYSNWQIATGSLALTELYDVPYNPFGLANGIGAAWATKGTAGSTGTGTASLSYRNTNGAVLIALRPRTNAITTGAITPASYCAGSAVSVPFTSTGTFNSGNIYTAQLSDASGSFGSPTAIGTLTSTANSGAIAATLPASASSGTGYLIRVISSNPAVTGSTSTSAITVNALPAAPTGSSPQGFCISSGPTVANLTASGSTINWYATASGGSPLAPTTALANGTHYYASQTSASGCESQARLDIVANLVQPLTGISYGTNPAVYCAGLAITANNPTVTGGTATSFTVSPALPPGLSINASTGVISGTPTTTGGIAAANYTVTASNNCGSVTVPVNITISPAAPGTLNYGPNSFTYCVGTAISGNSPSLSGGGPATSYSVSPSLPSGLSIDPTTGVISGTPSTTASGTYTVTASNSCGNSTKGIAITVTSPPTSISYDTNPAVYCAGLAITANNPTVTGGTATSYLVNPALPAGLSISSTTGVISGTPTTTGGIAATNYTVTASNTCGSATVAVNITISPAAPGTLNYASNSPTYCVGTPIASNNPTISGAGPATAYSVSPSLPSGLNIDPNTGVISGTPNTTGSGTYTVTASNSCGNTTKGVSITVNSAPSGITYGTNPAVYCAGRAITANSPTVTGGTATLYTVSPALPAGLSMSSTTGVISGTPTTTAGIAAANYTVTASNSCGSANVALNITISPAAPGTLSYASNAPNYCVGTAIGSNSPTISSGGPATAYSVSPSLPSGLSIDSNTGVISGTPNTTASGTYTITASNSCGNTTKGINITIIAAPSGISYGTNPAVYCAGQNIAANAPTVTGGTATLYTVSPALPSGLTLSSTTGVISGMPNTTGGIAAANYTVTASNSCGSANVALNITISPAAPGTLNYTTNTPSYCVGALIGSNSPSISGGGAATAYSVSPTLPAGLTLNTGTGVISGTPSVASAASNYTVTASNSCGSSTKTLTITVNDNATLALTSASGTDNQTLCIGTPLTSITYAIGGLGATGATLSGTLPTGVTGNYSGGVFTIRGTPTASGTFNYTVTTTGPCNSAHLSGTIYVQANSVLTRTSSSGTTNQTVCINNPIANITYSVTGGGTSASITSGALPAGVNGVFAGGVFTISGTPSVSGTYNYTVTSSGPCTNQSQSGTITVNDNATITLSSAAGTDNQSLCINTGITNITYALGGFGTTGATVSGLPTGVTGGYSGGVFTIRGNPTVSGTFNYRVTTTGPCTSAFLTGKLTVTADATITLTSASTTANQTLCANEAITNITYAIGGTGTGATVTGLPSGLASNYSGGVLTISGTPVDAGTFNYTVTATGPCANPSLSGTITSKAIPSGSLTASASTICAGQTVSFTAPSGNGSYIFYVNGVQKQGPGLVNSYGYNPASGDVVTVAVANSLNCGTTLTAPTVVVNPLPTAFLSSLSTICAGDNLTFTASSNASNPNYAFKVGGTIEQSGPSTTYTSNTITNGNSVTVTVTDANNCAATSDPIVVNVNPLPAAVLTPSASAVCSGSPVTFSVSAGASTYHFFVNGSSVVSGSSNTYTMTSSANPLVVNAEVTSAAGCKANSNTVSVTVNPLPTGSVSVTENSGTVNDNIVCVGSAVTFTASPGGLKDYAFYLNGTGAPLQSGTSNVYTTTSLNNGDYIRVVATNATNCSATFSSGSITVIPAPAGTLTVSPSNTICASDPVTFTATAIAGDTYKFKIGANTIQAGSSNVFQPTPGSLKDGDVVSVVVSNSNGCTSTFGSQTMHVNPLPTGTLQIAETAGTANDGIICTGTSVVFTAPAGFSNYNFLLNGASVQNGTSATYSTASLQNGDKVTVAVTNATGCTGLLNEWDIVVNPLPVVPSITGASRVCVGNMTTLSDADGGGTWSSLDVSKAVIDASTGVVTGVAAGTVQINYSYTNSNGCSSIANTNITVNPLPTVAPITGNFNVCTSLISTNSTSQLSDATPGGVWSSSNTAVATIDPASGLVTAVDVGISTISYSYTNANGCTSVATQDISVADLPHVDSITTTAPKFEVCINSTLPLKDATPGGTWASSNNGVATVSAAGVVTGISSGTDTITYSISTNCNQDAMTKRVITVNTAPSATISYGGTPFCASYSGSAPVTRTGTPGGNYSYTGSGTLSLDASSGAITPSTSTPGTYTVTYTIGASGGCSLYSNTATVTITPTPSATISYSGGPYFCTSSATVPVTRTGTSGGTYSYSGTGSLNIDPVTGTISPASSTGGTYTVIYTVAASGGCAQFTTSTAVIITTAPAASISYPGGPFCTTAAPVSVIMTGTSGGTYSSSGSGTLSINSTNGTITPASSTGGAYTVTYTVNAANGCSQLTANAPVTITAAPTVNAGTAVATCANSGTVAVTAGASASNYSSVQWTSSGTGTFANAGSLTGATYTPSAADISNGSVTLTLKANGNGNCGSVTATKLLTINPIPTITINPTSTTMCQGDIQALTANSTSGTSSQNMTVSSTGAVTIPDATRSGRRGTNYGEVNTSLNVSGIPTGAVITNVSIVMNVSHNNDGDLNFNIQGPNGNILNLVNEEGGYGNNFTNTVISQNATVPFSSGSAPFNGAYLPDASYYIGPYRDRSNSSSFSNITGNNNGNGTWTLYAEDVNDNGVGGTLNNWSVSIDYYVPNNNPVTWSPQIDLYTDASATVPYTGQALTTVYAKPSTSGNIVYTATGTNSNGCMNSASATLTVNPLPVVNVFADYCSVPGKVVLTATSSVGGTFLWDDGETSSVIQVDEAGDYFVTATSPAGCKGYGVISVAQELVTNGNFDAGNDGSFTSDYAYHQDPVPVCGSIGCGGTPSNGVLWDDSGNNGYSITTNGQNVHTNFWGPDHTSGTGNFMAVNGHGDVIRVWKETVNVLPNTIYYFSAWAKSLNDVGPFAQLRFSVNGTLVGTTAVLSAGTNSNSNNGWTRFYGIWTSDATTTSADIVINDLQSSRPGNDFGLDDVSFGTLSTFIRLESDPGTDGQTLCVNDSLTNIVYSVGSTASAPTITPALPAGLTSSFNGVYYTISGRPKVAGVYNYTISTSGNCTQPSTATGSITVQAGTIQLTSGTTSPIVCENTPVNIGFTMGGTATSATISSIPSWLQFKVNADKTITLSGTAPSNGADTIPYTITVTGSCSPDSLSGTIIIQAQTITLVSPQKDQTVCVNSPMTNIEYTIGGTATNATVTGLPPGVSGQFAGGTLVISGTPTTSAGSPYVYTIKSTGTCSSAQVSGTITITPEATITLSSGTTPPVCVNSPVTITYAVTNATGATASGLPAGFTQSYDPGTQVLTINGTPTDVGTISYTVTTSGGCGVANAPGIINVVAQEIDLASGSASPTVCINAAMPVPIVYMISGAATGATVTGLNGTGLTWNVAGNTVTISGTPTVTGTINYTVTTSGTSCAAASLSGVITSSATATGGTISSISECYDGTGVSGSLTLLGSVGTIDHWESSTDGITWTSVGNANSITLSFNNLLVPTRFRAVVTNSCGNVYSAVGNVNFNGYWIGVTSIDWNTASNWSDNKVPTTACPDVWVPLQVNQPTISNVVPAITNLHVLSGAIVTIDNGTSTIGGTINETNPYSIIGRNGTLILNGTASQTIPANTFQNNDLNNLTLDKDTRTITLAGPLNLYGTLSFSGGDSKNFISNGNLTLKSIATSTAMVADLTNNNTGSHNIITGDVTVERYIRTGQGAAKHGKAWEFLAIPTKGQSIYDSWMEGGSTASTGYGTQISGIGVGFDMASSQPSMKYLGAGDLMDWTGISNTADQIYNPEGYMVFVRGDRSVGPYGNTTPNPTTLRTKGALLTYNLQIDMAGITGFSSVGNPYAAPIDMRKALKFRTPSTVGNSFYTWKSPAYGTYGYGIYVIYTQNGVGDYEPTPFGVGDVVNNYIESGQAFILETSGSPANILFNETVKADTYSYNNTVFRGTSTKGLWQQLRTNLYSVAAGGKTTIADGTLIHFDDKFTNKVDINDSRKIFNPGPSLSIREAGTDLIVESRSMPSTDDTIYMRITSAPAQNYRFVFAAQHLASSGLQGYLDDHFLNTLTPISMEDTTVYDFAINNTAASKAADRFDIVFKKAIVPPPAITTFTATAKGNDVITGWNVINEANVKQYEVEISGDGYKFAQKAIIAAGNTGTASYTWTDKDVLPGYYYFRVKMINQEGQVSYSQAVKVLIGSGRPSISVYPNPVTNGVIHLQFLNEPAGKYGIRLMNQLGQVIVSKQVERMDGSDSQAIQWNYNLAHGVYQIEITRPDGSVKLIKVIY